MLCRLLLSVSGLFLAGNALILAACTNFHFGIIATVALGFVLLIYGVFFQRINAITKRGFLKFLRYFAYLCFVFFIGVSLFICGYGAADNVTYTEDVLIVLGAAVQGETVSLPLAHRLEKAVSYHLKNPDAVIVVSGGQGMQEKVTEALAMERYLLAKGVPQEKILKEERATSTYENFKYSAELLQEYFPDGFQAAFVTNGFHVYRAAALAKKLGIRAHHLHAKIEWYTVAVNYTREFCAVMKTWLLGA